MRRFGAALSALLLAALCGCASGILPVAGPAAPPVSGPVETRVRVTWKDAPLAGVRVEWRRDIAPAEDGSRVAATTGADGIARSAVPSGRWFLLAHWRKDGDFSRAVAPGDRFAFFGGNPVYLSGGASREIFLGLSEVSAPPPPPRGEEASPGASGVSGVVLADGAPLADAHVFAYIRTDTAFRDMGFAASAPTGADGAFYLDLPPGRYYLVARKRASGAVAGPLRKGDAFGYLPANPVDVGSGSVLRVSVPATTLRLRNTPGYSAASVAPSSIEGRILGPDGKPRRGLYAALYDNPDLLNRPVFISESTGEDGRYRLAVPAPGVYYLGARSGYGGSPAPGDLYGRYEGNAEHSVTIREGDRLTGFDVVVAEIR
jgi:hypothetical protein